MAHSVLYWVDGFTEAVSAHDWSDYPVEGVLWVDLERNGFRQRLMGRDCYWVHGDTFGMFNDPENLAWYGGDPAAQAEAWRWKADGSEPIDPTVPPGAHVLRGVMAPTHVWEVLRRAH